MRFYHTSWFDIMNTPVRSFWMLMKQMRRLQAEEALRMVDINMVPNLSKEDGQGWIRARSEMVGNLQATDETPKLDRQGWAELKRLAKQ